MVCCVWGLSCLGSFIVPKIFLLQEKENLFMYVNQAFAPSPDQTVHNLYQCFGSDGNLVLHYSKNQAWGWYYFVLAVHCTVNEAF